jgi:hypothetical protein
VKVQLISGATNQAESVVSNPPTAGSQVGLHSTCRKTCQRQQQRRQRRQLNSRFGLFLVALALATAAIHGCSIKAVG